jgi:hypothetical protein
MSEKMRMYNGGDENTINALGRKRSCQRRRKSLCEEK